MVRLVTLVLAPVGLLAIFWAAAALWFDAPGGPTLRGGLAVGLVVGALASALRLGRPKRGFAILGLFVAVLGWWLSLEPSNDRDWLPDVARISRATLEGERLTIRNVRNFTYRSDSDFDANWETRSWDLSELRGMDMFMSYWDSPAIAHTIVSWEFEQGPPLAISIETRKEVGESYSAVKGFFRQFELYYVVADERDVVGVRASHRGEQLRLYHLKQPPGAARAILLDYLRRINELAETPRWYNAATHNCTTTIRQHMQHVGLDNPLDWRVLVNGRLDELGYERGGIDTSLTFEALREASDITEKARRGTSGSDFSAFIRSGLPGGHPGADLGEHPREGGRGLADPLHAEPSHTAAAGRTGYRSPWR